MEETIPTASTLPTPATLGWMARQLGFAVPTGLFMGGVHIALGGPARRLSPSMIKAAHKAWAELLRDDAADARAGLYPSSLLTLPTSGMLSLLPDVLGELPPMVARARHKNHRIDDAPDVEDGPVSLPPYCTRAFHWQSDGWLSARSARLYEPSVEVMFMGTAAPMRRRMIKPVVEATRGKEHPRVVDVACGAGGFLTQLALALPRAHLGGVDLSASYIAHARAAVASAGVSIDLAVENAEQLPMRDGLVDAFTCSYLFHELPRQARRAVAAELFRALADNGVVVVMDAAQEHDVPWLKPVLDTFPATYHEPYFRSYQRDPLEDVLRDVGFQVMETKQAFLSRLVVARRPARAQAAV